MHPEDARRLSVQSGDLVRVDTEIGYLVDKVWVTEGIKPGVIALSHHLGRWRLKEDVGVNKGSSSLVTMQDDGKGGYLLRVVHGAKSWESSDPDTKRIWWEEVGVHQNLTHAVHPDPISGGHCWLQKARSVRKAIADEQYGDVFVDTKRSMEVYREWLAMTRSAVGHSPDGTRRPFWLNRPLKPVAEAYNIPTGGRPTAG
jgi:anaerobic selenocysteine-containing dehydrogenase